MSWLVFLLGALLSVSFGLWAFFTYKRRGEDIAAVIGVIVMIVTGILSALLYFVIIRPLIGLFTDLLWFDEVGYTSVRWTILLFPWVIFLVSSFLVYVFLTLNQAVAVWGITRWDEMSQSDKRLVAWLSEIAKWLVAIFFGVWLMLRWPQLALYLNYQPFNRADPIFGLDASFYTFVLPALDSLNNWLIWVMLATGLLVAALYTVQVLLVPERNPERVILENKLLKHFSFLGGLLLLVFAVEPWLHRYELLYEGSGLSNQVTGASFLAVYDLIPAMGWIAGISLLAGLASIITRSWQVLAVGAAIRTVFVILLVLIVPLWDRATKVGPAELSYEAPFLTHQISATRYAYNLEHTTHEFPYKAALSREELTKNSEILSHVRVVDWRPLLEANDTLQEVRQYYDFADADVDRYGDKSLMVSVREINPDQLPSNAKNWINTHLTYTHGYGYVVAEVNSSDANGAPNYVVRDLPMRGPSDLMVSKPQIYFGELNNPWIGVHTKLKEFGLPTANSVEEVSYQGTAGISLRDPLARLAFALRFDDWNLLFSDLITGESRLIFRRQIAERTNTIAPFLRLDKDPYAVIGDDRVYWIIDAYTTADSFPYADGEYIRNSVKVVIDAYDGKTTFYLMDDNDPVALSWAKILPGLFTPAEKMPSFLRSHLRYPEDLFQAQARKLTLYHMQDPTTFYNKQDLWEIPRERYFTDKSPVEMEPRYLVTRLPGGDSLEFLLVEPFVPNSRPNMIGWLAARMDPPHYGELALYTYPTDLAVIGPSVVEAQVVQHPTISRDMTFWDQRGSQVQWGHLIVLPLLGDTTGTTLFIKPLYIISDNARIPTLKKVVLVQGDQSFLRIIYEDNLQAALEVLIKGQAQQAVQQQPSLTEVGTAQTVVPTDISVLTKEQLLQLLRSIADELQRR